VELGAELAIGFIVVMPRRRESAFGQHGIFAGILGGVLKIVEIFHRTGAETGEAEKQENGGQPLHASECRRRGE
jgi:hypothetical protein